MKIAFTHNLKLTDAEEEAEFDTKDTVHAITMALSQLGHQVEPLEVSGPASRIVARLESLNTDLIFNTAEGSQGRFREAFYPSLFEQLSIPFTGSDAYTCLLTLDKNLTKLLLEKHGIQTPRSIFLDRFVPLTSIDLRFPVIVKPNFEGSSKGIRPDSVVNDIDALNAQTQKALTQYPCGILVEEFIVGKDIVVPYLERANPKFGDVLPACEYGFNNQFLENRPFLVYDYELKNTISHAVSVKVASDFTDAQKQNIHRISKTIFSQVGIRDFGRIDYRMTPTGELYFLEVNALPSLEPGAALHVAAGDVGLNRLEQVLDKVVESATVRYKIRPQKKKITPLTVGVTFNLKRVVPDIQGHNDVEAEFDSESTVNAIASTIESFGYKVIKLEATPELPAMLSTSGVDVVFNIAEGIRGRTRESQVPALLDLIGIEYTGSDAATMSLTLDKAMAKRIVRQAGILTPNFFQLVTGKEKLPNDTVFPLIIKPVAEGSSKGIFHDNVVSSESELRTKAIHFINKYKQPILVEQYISGREFTVGLLGGKKPKVLPAMEVIFLKPDEKYPVYSFEYKQAFNPHIRYDSPANITPHIKTNIEKFARACFSALGCRDVARIDLRMDANQNIYFLECNPIPGLVPEWSDICLMAKGAGLDYPTLIREIISPAIKRYREKMRMPTML